MELQAKIIQILPPQSGTSRSGKAWQSQEVITETLGQYPRKVKLRFFGDKAMEKASRLIDGQVYTFSFDLESREYNGRWYTEVLAYQVRDGVGQTPPSPQYPNSSGLYSQPYPQTPPQPQSQTYTPAAPYGSQPYGYAQPSGLYSQPYAAPTGNGGAPAPATSAPGLPGDDDDLPF